MSPEIGKALLRPGVGTILLELLSVASIELPCNKLVFSLLFGSMFPVPAVFGTTVLVPGQLTIETSVPGVGIIAVTFPLGCNPGVGIIIPT